MTDHIRETDTDPAVVERRAGRARLWWREHGQLITGSWLICVSIFVGYQAYTYGTDQARSQGQARVSCERSKVFGPQLALAYQKYRILNRAQLEEYRKTIPRSCP